MERKIILDLTPQYILSRVSEEEIFAKYVCQVEYDCLILNPMRSDKHVTANFYINNKNKLIFHDYNGFFHGDCFAAVQKVCGLGFRDALIKIANDFGILKGNANTNFDSVKHLTERKQKAPAKIQIKIQDWTEVDKAYWKSYYLNSRVLNKYHVSSVSHVWLNDKLHYTYKNYDPAYAYYFGNGFYKIYFPMRDEYRFLTNTNNMIIQGYDQLPEKYDFLIITKSLKDVLVLDSFNIPAIAPQAEGNNLPESMIALLKERFPLIFCNYDFDYAGVKSANKVKKNFGIEPLFLTNGRFNTKNFGSKDIADYIKNNGLEKTQNLIKEIYNQHII